MERKLTLLQYFRSTYFLKIAVIIIGLPVIGLCIFAVPNIIGFTGYLFPDNTVLQWLVGVDLYATAIPFYLALYQAFVLVRYIDQNKAFSDSSVIALKNIKYNAIAYGLIYILGLPLFYLVADKDDAPGIILIGLGLIFGAAVIAVFAAVLEKLLKEAIEMKSEYDLTV